MTATMSDDPKRYLVYRDDRLALEIIAEPGPLVSRSAPPPQPGEGPILHPFLSATAYDPENEGALRDVLERSASLDEYLARLREMGFRIIEG
jgi:hypothetical protein